MLSLLQGHVVNMLAKKLDLINLDPHNRSQRMEQNEKDLRREYDACSTLGQFVFHTDELTYSRSVLSVQLQTFPSFPAITNAITQR
jgi:hypothetical protein